MEELNMITGAGFLCLCSSVLVGAYTFISDISQEKVNSTAAYQSPIFLGFQSVGECCPF